jgi:O-antigen/teichoic acid export membrane protein
VTVAAPSRRTVLRNGAMAALQVVVLGLSLFVLYRVILRTIGVERLGVWSLVLATTSVGRMAQLGIGHGVVRFVSQELGRGDRRGAAEVIDTAAIATAVLAAAGALALYPLARWYVGFTVPATLAGEALPLVPWALASLAVGLFTAVYESGLDGMHRLDLRTLPAMVTTIVYVAVAIVLTRTHGLWGLAVAQLAQASLSLVATRALLGASMPELGVVPSRFSRARLRELLSFGAAVQAMNVGVLLFDPLTKALIARAGPLGAVGWYEMASRMVMQLRALAASALEALVPAMSHVAEQSRGAMRAAYVDASRAVLFLVPPATAATVALVPLVAELWIGRPEPEFTAFAWALSLSLLPSLAAVPAYYSNIALGHLRPNAAGVGAILAATLLLGWPLSRALGALGAVLGFSAAFALGHAIMLVGFHRREAVPLRAILPHGTLLLSVASAVAAGIATLLYFRLGAGTGAATRAVAVLAACGALLGPAVWRHPFRRELQGWVLPPGGGGR